MDGVIVIDNSVGCGVDNEIETAGYCVARVDAGSCEQTISVLSRYNGGVRALVIDACGMCVEKTSYLKKIRTMGYFYPVFLLCEDGCDNELPCKIDNVHVVKKPFDVSALVKAVKEQEKSYEEFREELLSTVKMLKEISAEI